MNTPLRVLIVEDSEDDALLLVRELRRVGYRPVWERVDSGKAMKAALDRREWDVVISDYSLPEFSGLQALEVLKQSRRDIPFLLVSGTVGEELAVSAMKAGAHDYLTKDNLKRLGPAIERELREAEVRRNRRRAEEALHRSEASYRSLILGATYGIFRCGVDGTFLAVNPALAAMLGYASEAELLGANFVNDICCSECGENSLLEQYRRAGRVDGLVAMWKRKDGSCIRVRLSGRPLLGEHGAIEGFEVIAEDVTERERLEEQLRQAQKMEAVGQLAGGIAHDFNNLLTIINGYAQLLLDRLDPKDPVSGHVQEIKQAGERAGSLTRQLLAFSRRQLLILQVLDLNAVVAGMQKMLRRLIREDIELETGLEPELGRVKADPGQIEQVILNLAVNAGDAMPRGGRLRIETANVELDDAFAREHIGARPGRYILLALSDTGCGMDEETQRHIFEPFFTTKEQGKGTGLGLATVYGIVKQSGGYIGVTSSLGRGTTFKVFLPRLEAPAEAAVARKATKRSAKGTETVLVVEDEEAVRPLVQGVLESRGYKVLLASQGDEALEIGRQYTQPIHLLLTDVVMPRLGGPELAERLGAVHPEARVLFMSGYTDAGILQAGPWSAEPAFLPKPFTPDELARRVREVLDGSELRTG